MTEITQFTGTAESLANALLGQNSGIAIVTASAALTASASTAVGLYDGSLSPLGIGAGILLTTGTMPGVTNTDTGFGASNNGAGNALIDQVINPVFSTASYDATTLSFSFNVTDPKATSISFDIVFGSDEYPEWVDAFVDAGVVFVNGVNYALFNHDPMHPLSVVSQNTQAGYFQDNTAGTLPIEYDGISKVLTIVAPIIQGGVNTITIGVADCGDHILDSGLFLSGMRAGTLPGSGVVIGSSDNSTSGDDTATGSDMSELFDMGAGDDQVYAGGGDDLIIGGDGADSLYGGSGDDAQSGGAGNDLLNGGAGSDDAAYAGASSDYTVSYDAATGAYSITGTGAAAADGTDSLIGIETVTFSDGSFYLTEAGLSAVAPVLPASNQAGSAIITGIAAADNTLTAAVSDADGVATAVAFDWQVSLDNGASWATTGVTGNSYTVQAGDAGAMFRVIASYTDGAGAAETVTSQPKLVPAAALNTLVVDLLQLDAPIGASTMNPLTTLIARAIDLGLSPNSAEAMVKAALGIDPAIKLLSYDTYAAASNDATALRVEVLAVQVAVLTSLSNDDTGAKLALALIEAQANGAVLDLADPAVLSTLTGVPADLDPITGKYPQPLAEIFDRNSNLAEAATVADVEKEWQDLLSIQDQIASTSITDLSVHINQAPMGLPQGVLAGMQDQPTTIAMADLLNGLSDPEGDVLSVISITADQSGTVTQNPDGSWTFATDAGYSGPVELSFVVVDPQGASLTVTKLLIIDATPIDGNTAPTISGAVQAAVAEDGAITIDPLANASDANGDALSVLLPPVLGDGFSYDPTTGLITFDASGAGFQALAAGETLVISQDYGVTDGAATTAAAITVTITGENDAAVIAGQAAGEVAEDTTLQASGTLTVTDADTDQAAFVAGTITGSYGSATLTETGDWTYTLSNSAAAVQALAGGATVQDSLTITTLDGTTAALTITITGADEPAVAGVTRIGNSKGNVLTGGAGADTLMGLGGRDSLIGGDGDDLLNGGTEGDTMIGGAGDDSYRVDHKSDTVTEAADGGHDTVITTLTKYMLSNYVEDLEFQGTRGFSGTGNALDNAISGGIGADLLMGGGGADTLSGGAGQDTLYGGSGSDVLTGGSGADQFVFKSTTDASDTITDFTTALDKIDLHFIDARLGKGGNQAFTFIANADFGAKAGQLRFGLDDEGAHVQGDVNGDGIADFELVLNGVTSLSASDFIL